MIKQESYNALYEKYCSQYKTNLSLNQGKLEKEQIFSEIDIFFNQIRCISIVNSKIQVSHIFRGDEEKLIEFSVILSCLPMNQIKNTAIFNLLYLFYFKASSNETIKEKYRINLIKIKKIYSKYIQSRVSFIFIAINSIPLKLVLIDFLPNTNPKITEVGILQEFTSYYRRYMMSIANVGELRAFFRNEYDLSKIFNDNKGSKNFSNLVSNFSQNPYIYLMFALHYKKIGLQMYYCETIFSNNVINISKFIRNYFLSVPFLSLFYLSDQQKVFSFYAMIPKNSINNLEIYLHNLKSKGFFLNYQIYNQKSAHHELIFDVKTSSSLLLSTILRKNPYKMYKKRKKVVYEEILSFKENTHDVNGFLLTPISLFLFFKSRELFLKIADYTSKKKFLKYIQPEICHSNFTEITRNFPKIGHFNTHFLNYKKRFCQKQIDQNSINKNFQNHNYKRFLSLMKKLGISNPDTIKNMSFKEAIFNRWEELNIYFSLKRKIPIEKIEIEISNLLRFNYIEDSKLFSIISLIQSEKSIIPVSIILKKQIGWIKGLTLLYQKNEYRQINIESNKLFKYFLYIDISTYQLFLKWLLLEDIDVVNIYYEQFYKRMDPIIINFFNFKEQRWEPGFFNFNHLIKKAIKGDDGYIGLKNLTLPFFLPKNIRKTTFNLKEFTQDFGFYTRMKETSINIKLNQSSFISILRKIYNSKQIQILNLNRAAFLPNENKHQFHQSFYNKVDINPVLSSAKRIILVLNQSPADLSPFLFEKDKLLRGFFLHASDTYFFGGQHDSITIFEYKINQNILNDKESQWNRLLGSITRKYPTLQIQLYEIQQEERYFNQDILLTEDWRKAEYLTLSSSKKASELEHNIVKISYDFKDLEVSDTNELILNKYKQDLSLSNQELQSLFQSNILYHPRFFNWQFWQISGYAFSLCLIIHNPGKKGKKVLNLLHQLPVGKIYHLKGMVKDEEKWCVFLHLRESIPLFLQKFTSILDSMRVNYTLSPVIPLEIYGRSAFPRVFTLSRTRKQVKFKDGDIIDIPLFPLRRSIETFTLEEFCDIGEVVDRFHEQISEKISKSKWKVILQEITLLWEKGELNQDTLEYMFQKQI